MHKNAQYRDYTEQWLTKSDDFINAEIHSPATTTNNQPSTTCKSTETIGSISARTKQRQRQRKKAAHLGPAHVKLAELDEPTSHSESESSAYDSFNEVVTDFCRDESDESEEEYIAQRFDFEYEVEDLSDSADLESCGSSSGVDDMVAKVMAKILHDDSSFSDSDITIFADVDTGESDAPSDPELGLADYWTCIKCKNQKNNPMYRFCEKCYQIRKNHFPPRPKHRKKRTSLGKRDASKFGLTSPSSRSSASSTHDDKHLDDEHCSQQSNSDDCMDEIASDFVKAKPSRAGKQRRRTRSSLEQANSAGESGTSSSQDLSTDERPSLVAYHVTSCASSSSQDICCSETKLHCANEATQQTTELNGRFDNDYPNSQETFYPNSEPCSQLSAVNSPYVNAVGLGKCDSTSSTSGYSSGVPSCESQNCTDGCSQVLTDGMMTDYCREETMTTTETAEAQTTLPSTSTAANQSISLETTTPATKITKKSKKRKCNFDDTDSEVDDDELMAKKFHAIEPTDPNNDLCMICLTEPKNGAFIHNRFVHVCCCYRCTVKVWNKRKRCPICNLQVKTVLKTFVY